MNTEFIKGSNYTLDELFAIFKTQYLTAKDWSEILKVREGIINFNSLYQILKMATIEYDKSSNVNSFYYKNRQYWLDKDTRIGLFRLIDSGAEQVTLQLGDNYISINAGYLKNFLNELEVYAGKCFTATANHLTKIKSIHKLEDLINYDYTTEYPDKITLNED